jgi:hypothetical protein
MKSAGATALCLFHLLALNDNQLLTRRHCLIMTQGGVGHVRVTGGNQAMIRSFGFLSQALPYLQLQESQPETPGLSLARGLIRALIGLLILLLLSYIVIEQAGSWRRRRSGRD